MIAPAEGQLAIFTVIAETATPRKALVVAVKVVNGYGILQKQRTRTSTASEHD
jgi:hypothetical protein